MMALTFFCPVLFSVAALPDMLAGQMRAAAILAASAPREARGVAAAVGFAVSA